MSAAKLITAAMLAAVLPALASPSSAQVAPRPGFAAPAPGETRFVADEVILSTRPNVSAQALTAIAARNRLTRMESQDAVLTGLRFYRWRIDSGVSVATATTLMLPSSIPSRASSAVR